jgi:uncharacterized membrane-anchored protein
MTTTRQAAARTWSGREMLNKVPEVTLFFWVIKIMCTTVGETAADYLNVNMGWGLTNTTSFTGALLAVILLVQFRLRRYVPRATSSPRRPTSATPSPSRTSYLFLGCILALVAYLPVTKRDQTAERAPA